MVRSIVSTLWASGTVLSFVGRKLGPGQALYRGGAGQIYKSSLLPSFADFIHIVEFAKQRFGKP